MERITTNPTAAEVQARGPAPGQSVSSYIADLYAAVVRDARRGEVTLPPHRPPDVVLPMGVVAMNEVALPPGPIEDEATTIAAAPRPDPAWQV